MDQLVNLRIFILITILSFSGSLCAQIVDLSYAKVLPKTTPEDLQLKGNIEKLTWIVYSPDPLLFLVNSTTDYTFKNNKVDIKKFREYAEMEAFVYNNGKLFGKTWTNGTSSDVIKYRHKDNTIETYRGEESTPYHITTFNKSGKIIKAKGNRSAFEVQYTNDTPSGEVIKEVERNYNDKGRMTVQHTYEYSYSTGNWNGKPVKIRSGKLSSKASGNLRYRILTTYYDKKGREIFYQEQDSTGYVSNRREYFYKDDARGNWIAKMHYDYKRKKLEYFEQRQISYADGFVSGRSEIKKDVVNLIVYPQIKNKYSFNKVNEKGSVHIVDPAGNQIAWRVIHLGFGNTNNFYILDEDNYALIELTNFKNTTLNKYQEAKVLNIGNSSFYYEKDKKTHFVCFQGKVIKNYGVVALSKNYLVFYDKFKDQSLKVTINAKKSLADQGNIYPLDILPKSKNHAYWSPMEGSNGVRTFIFIENGKYVLPSKETHIMSGVNEYVKTKLGYYLLENHKTKKLASIYIPKTVSESEFNKAKANYKKLISTSDKIDKFLTKVNTTKKVTTNTNFGCNNDLNCLSRYFNSRISNLTAQGKTKDEAAKITGQELESLFKSNGQLAYNVMMKVDSKYITDIVSNISPETRAKFRGMAMKEVQAFEKKYGTKKIKTTTYKPKKKNN